VKENPTGTLCLLTEIKDLDPNSDDRPHSALSQQHFAVKRNATGTIYLLTEVGDLDLDPNLASMLSRLSRLIPWCQYLAVVRNLAGVLYLLIEVRDLNLNQLSGPVL